MTSQATVRPRFVSPLRLVLFGIGLAVFCVAPFFQLHLIARYGERMLPGTHTADSDLYAPWFGTLAALHHQNPYSAAVTSQIQVGVYGHTVAPGSGVDPQAFVYPAYIVFLLGPFTLLSWPDVYRGAAALGPFVIAASAWAWLRLCRCRYGPLVSFAVILLIVTSWPAVWSCNSRQPSLFVAAALAFSLLLYSRGTDIAAGFLLALATIKPHLVLLLGIWLLLQALAHRRSRFVAAFSLTLLLLVSGSLVLLPHWIPDWIRATLDYSRHSGKHSVLISLTGPIPGLVLDGTLLGGVIARLGKLGTVDPESPRFAWAAALLLAATDCLIPANPWLVYNNLLLIPGVLLVFRSQPAHPAAVVLRTLARLCILFAVLITPICAALGSFLGFSVPLALFPFLLHFVLPVPVAAALLFLSPPAEDGSSAQLSPLPAMAAFEHEDHSCCSLHRDRAPKPNMNAS